MRKILALGLAVLLLASVVTCLPVVATEDTVAEPTYTVDFTGYCHPEDYGFSNLSDVVVEGGTQGYYTFTAVEDGVQESELDPKLDLPVPDVNVDVMDYAVILYRTESNVRGELFVDRADDVLMGQIGSHVYWQYADDGEWHLEMVNAARIWGDAEGVGLRRLRFDPLAMCEADDFVDVSYIKFFATEEDALSYVTANAELRGDDYGTTTDVVMVDDVAYGYRTKVAVEYAGETMLTEQLDWNMGQAMPSPNLNEHLLLKDVADRDAVMKNGVVIAWAAGGYPTADHPLYAIHGQDNQYLLFESMPFADYDRVTVILTTSGSAGNGGDVPADDYSMIVGFVSDTDKLYGLDVENPNLEADIVHGICPPASEGQVNLSGLGMGAGWNVRERAVTMNIEGITWDGPAALYVGSRSPHIPVVVKILFEREVAADLYVDADGNEFVMGRDVIRQENDEYFAYADLFDVTPTDTEGVYEYDLRKYFGVEPAIPQAPTHTITFLADGKVVATYEFYEGSTEVEWEAPAVPEKAGFVGSWPTYVLGGTEDMEVKAHYALAPVVTPETSETESATDTEAVTEADTEAVTDVEENTEATVDTTAEAVDGTTAPEAATTTVVDDGAAAGCKSVLGGAAVLAAVLALGVAVSKKKD